jgi:hypothetical protein
VPGIRHGLDSNSVRYVVNLPRFQEHWVSHETRSAQTVPGVRDHCNLLWLNLMSENVASARAGTNPTGRKTVHLNRACHRQHVAGAFVAANVLVERVEALRLRDLAPYAIRWQLGTCEWRTLFFSSCYNFRANPLALTANTALPKRQPPRSTLTANARQLDAHQSRVH